MNDVPARSADGDGAPVDVGAADDPVAAVLAAHAAGQPLLLRTSGSTGPSRAVVRTTRSWFDSFDALTRLTRLSAGSRVWVPGPLTATMNLFAAVLAAHVGAAVLATPRGATHAHLTPSALDAALRDRIPLAGVHLTVAGDRLRVSSHRAAVAAGAEVSHYLGSSEQSFVAWGSHEADLTPFPGVELDLREGLLWVRSPYLCSGYAGPPGALRTDPSGFSTVGDRARWRDGFLVVVGRGTEAVTTGGATVLVADVEEPLRVRLAGELVVVGLPHTALGEVVTAVLTDAADLATARETARRSLQGVHRPRLWFHLPVLPLTGAGKIDRAAIVRRLLEQRPLTR